MQDRYSRSGATGTIVRKDDPSETQETFNQQETQLGEMYKSYLDGYEGHNPKWVMNELRTNQDMMNELTQSMYRTAMDGHNEETKLDELGKTKPELLKRTEGRVRRALNRELYEGEEVTTTVKNHLRDLRTSQDLVPVNGARETMQNNPQKYGGYVDDNGEVMMDSLSLKDALKSDNELYDSLMTDRFKEFEDQLGKGHNAGVINTDTDTTNPEEYSKAFLVYDKYGKEGLSNYINIIQHYDADKPYEEQNSTAQKAIDFYLNSDKGQSPKDYVEENVKGMNFNPVKVTDVPAYNENDYTKLWYEQGDTPDERIFTGETDAKAFANLAKIALEGEDTDKSWGEWASDLFFGNSDEMEQKIHETELQADNAEIMPSEFFDSVMDEGEDFYQSSKYTALKRLIGKRATDEDSPISAQDLLSTIQSYATRNGGRQKSERGVRYGINFKEAPKMVQFAIEALQDRAGFDTMFSVVGDQVTFEPQRMQRVQSNLADLVDYVAPMDVEEKVLPDGEVLKEKKMSNGIGAGTYNTFTSFGLSYGKVFYDFGAEMVGGLAQRAGQLTDYVFNGGETTDFSRSMDSFYEGTRDTVDASIMGLGSSGWQKGGAVAGSLFGFLQGLKKIGRGVNRKVGETVSNNLRNQMIRNRTNMLQEVRRDKNFSAMSKLLAPPKNAQGSTAYKRSAVRMRKLAEGLKGKGEGWATNYADFVTGGAVYETLLTGADKNYQDRYSLLGSGMADLAVEYGTGYDTDIEGWYESVGDSFGGRFIQMGLGIVAEEVLGHVIDTGLGALRMSKNGAMTLMGKDFSGLYYGADEMGNKSNKLRKVEIDNDKAKFEQMKDVAKEGFTPDWRRFFKELNKDLDEIPRGDMGDTLNTSGRMVGDSLKEIENMDDFARTVATSIKPFVKDIKQQIRDSVVAYRNALHDTELDGNVVDAITESLYNGFYKNVAESMGRVMDGEEVTAFMRGLEKFDEASVERVTLPDGSKYMSETEARSVAKEFDNARIQSVEVDGREMFEVLQITPNRWAGDFIGALDEYRNNKVGKESLENFKGSDYFKSADNKQRALDYYHAMKDGNVDLSVDGKKYIVEGVSGENFVLKDVTGAERQVPMKELENRFSLVDEDTPTPSNINASGLGASVEAKKARQEGRNWLKENVDEFDDTSVKEVDNVRKKLTEELARLAKLRENDGADVDAIDAKASKINNALDHLDARKESLSLDRDTRSNARQMTQQELENERQEARMWLEGQGQRVDYDDPDSVDEAINALHRQHDELQNSKEFGDSNPYTKKNVQDKIGDVVRAKEMLEARKAEMDKGIKAKDRLPDGVRRWLENEDGLIDLWDPKAVSSRIQTLRNIKENPSASNTIERFNPSELDGGIKFLEDRLDMLEGRVDGEPAADSQMKKVVKDTEHRQTEQRVSNHRKRTEESFGSAVKRVDEKLENGHVKSYRTKIAKARKADETLEESGVNSSYLNEVGETVDSPEKAKTVVTNVGGAPLTDYNTIGKQRGVRKWDPEKGGKTGNVYRVQNEDGSVEHVIVNHKPVHPNGGTDKTVPMRRFIEIDGEWRMNPFYRFISPNKLTGMTGELRRVSVADVPDPRPEFGGVVVKVDEGGEMVANVQRPFGESGRELGEDEFIDGNYDAIEFTHGGDTYYKLVSKDQIMEAGVVADESLSDTSKFGLYDITPSFRAQGANPPYKNLTPVDELELDMRSLGFVNDGVFKKLKNSAQKPVKGHKKHAMEDAPLGNVKQRKTQADRQVDHLGKLSQYDAENLSRKKLEAGDYEYGPYRIRKRKMDDGSTSWIVHQKDNPNGAPVESFNKLSEAEAWTRRGVKNAKGELDEAKVRQEGYDDLLGRRADEEPETKTAEEPQQSTTKPSGEPEPIDPLDLKVGDVFSKHGRHTDEFVNAEVTDVTSDDRGIWLKYRSILEGGEKGPERKIPFDNLGDVEWFKPFAMSTPAMGIMVFGDDLNITNEDFDTQNASFSSLLGMAILGGVAGKAMTKGYVKYFPKSVGRTKRWMKGFAENAIGDPATAKTREIYHNNKPMEKAKLEAMGIEVDEHTSNDFARDMVRIMEEGDVNKIGTALMHNQWIQSTKSFAEVSGSDTLREFITILENMDRRVGAYRMSFEEDFNRKHGVNAFKEFFQDGWKSAIDGVDQRGLNEDEMYDQFNDSFWRLMNSKIEFNSDGTARVSEQPDHFSKIYDDGDREFLQEMDNTLLGDERVVDAIKSMRTIFKKTENERLKVLTQHEVNSAVFAYLPDYLRRIKRKNGVYEFNESEYIRHIEDFVLNFEGSWKEYKKLFKNGYVKGLLKNAEKHDPEVKKIIDLRRKGLHFTEGLGEHYFPQIVSRSKTNKVRQSFMDKVSVLGKQMGFKNSKEADEAFERQLKGDINRYNDIDGRLSEFDKDAGKMVEKKFDSGTEAIAFLNRTLHNASQDARSAFERQYGRLSVEGSDTDMNKRSLQEFIRKGLIIEETERVDMGDGRKKRKKQFYINTERMGKVAHTDPEGNRVEFDLLKEANTKGFDDLHSHIMSGGFVKNSNFLERPRVYNLPPQYLETNPVKALDIYARDVGFRMEMMKNGVIDEDSLNNNWFKKIRRELGDDEQAVAQMKRVKTAYNIMGNIMPDMPAEKEARKLAFQKRMRMRQMSEVWRNMLYSKYAVSIGMLDTIQPLISTAIYTSYGSVLKGYRDTMFSKQALDNLINVSKEYEVVTEHHKLMTADYMDSGRYNVAGSGIGDALLGWGVKGSRKWNNIWADKFSFLGPESWKVGTSGIPQLMGGSLHSKSQINITHAWYTFLTEAISLGKAYRKMADGEGVKGMSRGDVMQRMELLGINRNQIDTFAENVEEVENMMVKARDEGKRLTSDQIDSDYQDIIDNIIYTASETYTGRNKMWRPEGWHSDGARAMTTFMNFSFNQALQITQNRFLRPMNRWLDQYGDGAGKIRLGHLLFNSKMRNPKSRAKYLKKQGLSDEAIENMPYNAIETMGKVALSTGINAVFQWSLSSLKAFASLAIAQSAFDFDMENTEDKLYGQGFKYNTGEFNPDRIQINPTANLDDQVELGDIKDLESKENIAKTWAYMTASMGRVQDEMLDIGIAGPMVGNITRYGDAMPAGLSMATRFLETGWKAGNTMGSGDFWKWENMPKAMYNVGTAVLPPMSILDGAKYEH